MAAPKLPQWVGRNSEVQLGKLGAVRGPMCYFANSLRRIPMPGDAIDLARGVKFDDATRELASVPARPSYGGLSALQRGAYLRWIVAGRSSAPGSDGFATLFLAGLERRALVDRQDIADIFDEVLRLISKGVLGPAARRQYESFAWFLAAGPVTPSVVLARLELLAVHTSHWVDDRACVLGNAFVTAKQALPGWAAFALASHSAGQPKNRSLTAFRVAYSKQYPTGVLLPAVPDQRLIVYRPANAELSPVELRIGDLVSHGRTAAALARLFDAPEPAATVVAPKPASPVPVVHAPVAPAIIPRPPTPPSSVVAPLPASTVPVAPSPVAPAPAPRTAAPAPVAVDRVHTMPVSAASAPPPLPPVRPIANQHTPPASNGLLSILRNVVPRRPVDDAAVRRPVQSITWCGPADTVELPHVGIVRAPLVYLDRWSDREPAAVRIDLPIAPALYRPASEHELGYWPRYDGLNLAQRRYYVDWLGAGRQSVPHELGYTFLFIYGLERRSLVDRLDVAVIVDEVLRLKRLYAESRQPVSRSFDAYTDQFLWMLAMREPAAIDAARVASIRDATRMWNEDTLAAMLCLLARDERPLDAESALLLTRHLPDAQQGVVVRRAGNELRELFLTRFSDRYPDAMPLRNSKRDRRYGYRPASAALQTVAHIGPNPWGLQSQFAPLVSIWNACVDDLRKFSAARRLTTSDAALTAEAWAALPKDLRDDVEHPHAGRLAELVADCSTPDAQIRTSINRVAVAIQLKPTGGKLTPALSRRLAETVADAGYGMEPDARLSGKGYSGDEDVALFRLDDADSSFDPLRYGLASTMLRVGMYLAASDGSTDERESTIVTQQVAGTLELSEIEERRLAALRGLLGAKGVELTELTKLLRKLDLKRRELMSQLVLAIVAADGVISAEELVAVRKLYRAIGFEKAEIDRTIQQLRATDSAKADDEAPVVVVQATKGEFGESIPMPMPEVPTTIRLDRAAIARTLRESQEAAQLIAEAMKQEGAEEVIVDEPAVLEPTDEMVVAVTTADAVEDGVPARYAAFYQVVVTRQTWSRAELVDLAKAHGLMLDGALDAINEWSTERHSGPLIYDDGDTFSLEQSYLN